MTNGTGTALAVALSLGGAYGAFLVVTALLFDRRDVGWGVRPAETGRRWHQGLEGWLASAGVDGVAPSGLVAVVGIVLVFSMATTFVLFGAILPAAAVGVFAASFPVASLRSRRTARARRVAEAWPQFLEEVSLRAGSLGRSIPQALFEAGQRSVPEVQEATAAAQREWLLSTDLGRSLAVLKSRLADPGADAACETLLVAHELGGSDVPGRLRSLVDDRIADLHGRRDAWARQAGVRFARRFVLLVPLGMALVGLSIGNGRDAYQTSAGQATAAVGVGLVAACWFWSGRILHLPGEERVFHD